MLDGIAIDETTLQGIGDISQNFGSENSEDENSNNDFDDMSDEVMILTEDEEERKEEEIMELRRTARRECKISKVSYKELHTGKLSTK